jgi:hypothetical protein
MRFYVSLPSAIAVGALAAHAAPTKQTHLPRQTPVFIPTFMEYNSTGKLYAAIQWDPNSTQQALKTVMDLGSANNWVCVT